MKEKITDGLPLPQRYGAIATVILGLTVAVLDGTIANVALPTIARDLDVSAVASVWVINAYHLAVIVALLPLASLGDIIGYRRIYLGGIVVFSVTSLVCALSDSLWTLTLARVLQGLGAAGLMSVNIALIRLIYPQRYLGRGMGLNALTVAVSSAAGPTITAGVLSVASWPWLFAINVPVGVMVLGLRFLPAGPARGCVQHFDALSAVLNALTFGLLILALSGVAQRQAVFLTLSELTVALLAGVFFVRRQLHQPRPLLPVDLLRIPVFSLSIGTSVCSFCAQMLAFVSLPFFLQDVLGKSEVATGLLLTPWLLATMILSPVAGRLSEKSNTGVLSSVGLVLFSAGLLSLALLSSQPSDIDIIWRMVLCGTGFGLFQTPNNHVMISATPRHRSGSGGGMQGTARLFGQATGAALVALMFNLFEQQGTQASLLLSALFAALGMVVSAMRIRRFTPAGQV
jgi:DHA2 family multidrug resistance protein-like MFS transporter